MSLATKTLMRFRHKLDSDLRRAALRTHINKPLKNRLVRVIIQYRESVRQKHINHLTRCAGQTNAKRHTKLHLIRGVSVTMPLHRIHHLCKHSSVKRVYVDRRKSIRLNHASPTVGATAVRSKGLTGSGITVAVLDTGVYPHPDLTRPSNRIIAFRDFINGRTKPYDDNGHGTHCAGDAAGNGYSSKRKYTGAAPGARIAGVKVLDANGSGFDSTIIRGIEWCVSNRTKYGIRVVSMSLGGKATEPWNRDPVCQAIRAATAKGLVVVVAAGNSGPGGGTIESPGISPHAITVGASNDRDTNRLTDDTVASFSSRGPARGGVAKPDLLAPGVSVVSLRAPGSRLDRSRPGSRVGGSYFRLSGTSMATPITAGAAALVLQKNRAYGPSRVKNALKRNAYSLRLNSNTQGAGIVNVRFLAGT